MTLFSCYIFVKTAMSFVEQISMSNQEYSPDSYLHYHLAAEQSVFDAWGTFCVLCSCDAAVF